MATNSQGSRGGSGPSSARGQLRRQELPAGPRPGLFPPLRPGRKLPEASGESRCPPAPARDPRAKKGRAWRAGERRARGRPGTHVLAVAAPREPGRRRDKSADCPAGKTRVAGALPRPLWDAGGLTRWSGPIRARDPRFACLRLAS